MSDRESSGLLMSVIRTLHETDTGKEREDEKKKLEQQFKQCDQVMILIMITLMITLIIMMMTLMTSGWTNWWSCTSPTCPP